MCCEAQILFNLQWLYCRLAEKRQRVSLRLFDGPRVTEKRPHRWSNCRNRRKIAKTAPLRKNKEEYCFLMSCDVSVKSSSSRLIHSLGNFTKEKKNMYSMVISCSVIPANGLSRQCHHWWDSEMVNFIHSHIATHSGHNSRVASCIRAAFFLSCVPEHVCRKMTLHRTRPTPVLIAPTHLSCWIVVQLVVPGRPLAVQTNAVLIPECGYTDILLIGDPLHNACGFERCCSHEGTSEWKKDTDLMKESGAR